MEDCSGDEVALIRLNQERKMWRKDHPHVKLLINRGLLLSQKLMIWTGLICSNGDVKSLDLRDVYGRRATISLKWTSLKIIH